MTMTTMTVMIVIIIISSTIIIVIIIIMKSIIMRIMMRTCEFGCIYDSRIPIHCSTTCSWSKDLPQKHFGMIFWAMGMSFGMNNWILNISTTSTIPKPVPKGSAGSAPLARQIRAALLSLGHHLLERPSSVRTGRYVCGTEKKLGFWA